MQKNSQIKIGLFLFTAVILFFIIYIYIAAKENPPEGGKFFNFQKTDMSYYEFVYEDITCGRNPCLTEEYIIFSSGLVFKKTEEQTGGKEKTEAYIGKIEKNKAEEMIGYAKIIVDSFGGTGTECANCRLYHVFYGDMAQTKAVTKRIENAPESIREIGEMTRKALGNFKPSNSFFIHFVFEPKGGNTIDYHFFSDGTVLKEYFGMINGDLSSSALYSLNSKEVDELMGMVGGDYFKSTDNLESCVKTDLNWGYLEVKRGNNYHTVYTCGNGQSGADKLFEELLKKTDGK